MPDVPDPDKRVRRGKRGKEIGREMTRDPSDRTRGVHVLRRTSAVPSLVSGNVVNQAMAPCWYAKDAP